MTASNENYQYVAQRKKATTIRMMTKPPSPSSGQSSMVTIRAFESLCRAFEELLNVTKAEAAVKQRDPAVPEAEINESISEIDGVENPISIQNSNGVTSANLTERISEITADERMELYVPSIDIVDTSVAVYLCDGFHTVTTSTTDSYRYVPVTSDTDSPPSKPVIWGQVTYTPGKLAYEYDQPIIQWYIHTPTDIWFEESQLGRINRARFHECLARLDTELEILDVVTVSRGLTVTETDIDGLFEYDGPSSEELIEQYCTN